MEKYGHGTALWVILQKFKHTYKGQLLLMLFMLLSFNSFAALNLQKRISIEKNDVSYDEVLTEIKEQTGIIILYSNDSFDFSKKTSVKYIDVEVGEAINELLKGTGLVYSVYDDYIVIKPGNEGKQQQQQIQPDKKTKSISGVITDNFGAPMPGTNIIIKGTTTGTVSDIEGRYSIEVEEGSTLVINFIGFKTKEVVVSQQTTIDIIMVEDFALLDQIIVAGVASGTSKKKMSVSVAKLNSDVLNKVPQSNVSSSLQGKVAGVTITNYNGSPGASSSIMLRGATQLNLSQSPMIMVDGIIYTGSLAEINVDDIESMEVVKGAAASSLYGSRAANGVIVITSKRGSKLSSGETVVTLRNEVGIQQLAKKLETAQHHNFLLAEDWQNYKTYTRYAGVDYPDNYVTGYDPVVSEGQNKEPLSSGMMTQPFGVYHDPQEELLTEGLTYTNFVSVASRINQTNLYISFENNSNEGILKHAGGYERQSLRMNVDHAISHNIKLSASSTYIKTANDMASNESSTFYNAIMMSPDVDLLRPNANGDPYNFIPDAWNASVKNPLYYLGQQERLSHKNIFLGNYEINWSILNWMSFKASYSVESEDYERKQYTPKGSYVGFSSGDYIESVGTLTRIREKEFNQNYRATLSFNKIWGDLDFKGKLSYLGEDNYTLRDELYGRNFELSDYPSFAVVDRDDESVAEYIYQTRAENFFAIASFVYKDRYIFDGLVRQDISSRFGADQRKNIYYRASAAYRLSKDIEIPGVQELKIRGAIGTAGIRPGYDYQYETYNRGTGGVYAKNTLGNKDLKPSFSEEIELGLDISFLNRFNGELTYSNTKTSDQFVRADLLSHKGGFVSQWKNAATMESNTFEAMLNTKVIRKQDWNWDVTLTFDKTKTVITELDIPEGSTDPGDVFYIKEGELFGTMYGNTFVRTLDQMANQLPEGDVITDYAVNNEGYVVRAGTEATSEEKPIHMLDENGDKVEVKIGDTNPDFRMGISSTLSYKSLSFYMLWRLKYGGQIYNSTARNMVRDRRLARMDQYGKKPEEMKAVGYYDVFYQGISDYWVEDASYLKLGEASINYTLRGKNLGKLNKYISSVDFGLIGRNLLMFSDYTGFDPESMSGGYIYDSTGYPTFRTYSFSLGIKF